MAEQGLSLADIVADIHAILQTIEQQVTQQGAAAYEALQEALAEQLHQHILRYIRFLEERALIVYDRVSDELTLTDAGQDALEDPDSWRDEAADAFDEHIYEVEPLDEVEADSDDDPTDDFDEDLFDQIASGIDEVSASLMDSPKSDEKPEDPAADTLFDGAGSAATAEPAPTPKLSISSPAAPPTPAQSSAKKDQLNQRRDSMNAQGIKLKSTNSTELYERVSELGVGGVGTVYRATQTKLNREVALKEVNQVFNVFAGVKRDDIIAAFTDVVQRQASLVHPNIVQILDIETETEFPYVVSQFAPRGNLRRLIEMPERPALTVALKYFMQILAGLSIAHDNGIIHGNIKPENVVLDAAGNAMLSDFGMANVVEREGANTAHVYVGVGTVAYMSPEQFQNPNAATVRSDIYSLGIMFYEMLTGKVPGRRSPMPSSFYPDIPRDLDDIFDKMSVDAIEDRYENVNEILAELYGSEDCMSLLDNRSGVLFMRDPIEFGEFGGVDPGELPSGGFGLAEISAGRYESFEEDSDDSALDAQQLDDELSEAGASQPEQGGDVESEDVLGKLDKYGDMFKEEG